MKQRGMTLLAAIFLIGIMTSFLLSLWQTTLLYLKLNQQMIQAHEAHYALEKVTQAIWRKLRPACVVLEKNPNVIIKSLTHSKSCLWKEGNKVFHYLISDLGVVDCMQIRMKNQNYGSHHWLITVMDENKNGRQERRVQFEIQPIQCTRSKVVVIEKSRALLSVRSF